MKVAIIDDEPLARARIRKLLADHKDMTFVGDARNGEEGIELLKESNPELVFLDIGMPDMDGFELLSKYPKKPSPYVIFSTAYPEHAVKAFEVEAVDYLLKPYNKKRFDVSVEKARKYYELASSENNVQNKNKYLEEVIICERGREDRVNLSHVMHFQAFGNYVKLGVKNKSFLYRCTMAKMANQLDPEKFMRVHRSHIVNINFISRISYMTKNEYMIYLQNGVEVTSGRKYMPVIKEHLSNNY